MLLFTNRYRTMLMEKMDILRSWHNRISPHISRHLSTKSFVEDSISPLLHILSPPTLRPVIHLHYSFVVLCCLPFISDNVYQLLQVMQMRHLLNGPPLKPTPLLGMISTALVPFPIGHFIRAIHKNENPLLSHLSMSMYGLDNN